MSDAEELAAAKERAWRQAAEIDAALERGDIDLAGWHAAWQAIIEPAYLSGGNPRAESGHSGDERRWETARRLLVDALPGDCAFLDVGCANGYLMHSLTRWAADDGIAIEPYGVDISSALGELARHRHPQWAGRIWTANAMEWHPPRRFDVVRTGMDYVPARLHGKYLAHLLEHIVAERGRLVIGVYNEDRDLDTMEQRVRGLGYGITGRTSRRHRHPALAYKAFWLDRD